MIVFDFGPKTIKIGSLEPVQLRAVLAETKLDSLQLQVDKDFLSGVAQLPGMQHYASDEEPEEPEPNEPQMEVDVDELMAANGMVVPYEKDLESALGELLISSLFEEGLDQGEQGQEGDDVFEFGLVLPEEESNEVDIAVSIDADGNLVACPEIELVSEKDEAVDGEGWVSHFRKKQITMWTRMQASRSIYLRTIFHFSLNLTGHNHFK